MPDSQWDELLNKKIEPADDVDQRFFLLLTHRYQSINQSCILWTMDILSNMYIFNYHTDNIK